MTTVVTDRGSFEATASDAPAKARVPVEVRTTVEDPFTAYRRARDGPGGFYLETGGGQAGWGYFGVAPTERLQTRRDAVAREGASAGLAALDGLLAAETLTRGACQVPFPCAAVGWLSYDLARELEDLPGSADDDRGLPRLQVGLYDVLAAWREPHESPVTLRVTACPRLDAFADAGDAYQAGRERAIALARRATRADQAAPAAPAPADTATFESDCGRAAFRERVRRVQQYITDGDTFQANISHRLRAPAAVHPVTAFEAVRRVNPAPYAGLLEFPGVDLVSASPELLVRVDGERIQAEPIAGTRPRGATSAADRRLEQDLRGDEKERAEHAMLVDLARNDLGKVSAYGSVDVTEYRRVDRYAAVMHLVSVVEGQRRADCGLADAVAAVFPGGTITGAPKPRTMEIIDEVETTRRGPYTGSIGLFGFDGQATLNIVIRTLVRVGDEYHLRVGAGIVHDSDPDREYDETLDKARALVDAVDEALAAETDLVVER